ncbi:unnamed protein product [Rhizoctonia solani]|uniref:Uncharacterized protein n=1 Tax=Rhizoctonia solani TaxID=456999 RepID=A0A8H3GH85_9AGAM|nr:unnamed protein product [Rhizoctonia solani]
MRPTTLSKNALKTMVGGEVQGSWLC